MRENAARSATYLRAESAFMRAAPWCSPRCGGQLQNGTPANGSSSTRPSSELSFWSSPSSSPALSSRSCHRSTTPGGRSFPSSMRGRLWAFADHSSVGGRDRQSLRPDGICPIRSSGRGDLTLPQRCHAGPVVVFNSGVKRRAIGQEEESVFHLQRLLRRHYSSSQPRVARNPQKLAPQFTQLAAGRCPRRRLVLCLAQALSEPKSRAKFSRCVVLLSIGYSETTESTMSASPSSFAAPE